MNQQRKLVIALVVVISVILIGSLGIAIPGLGQTSSSNTSQSEPATLVQTAVIVSTDVISAFTTRTASITLTQTLVPESSTREVSSSSSSYGTLTESSASIPVSSFKTMTDTTSQKSTIFLNASTTESSTSGTRAREFIVFRERNESLLFPIHSRIGRFHHLYGFSHLRRFHACSDREVLFASNMAGTFTPPDCSLTKNASLVTCSTAFTPAETSLGQESVTAAYSGDLFHSASSSNNFPLIVVPGVSMIVTCSPNNVTIATPTSCTAIVNNPTGLPIPVGTVIFSSDKPGTFAPPKCTLNPAGSCSVAYSPGGGSVGPATVIGAYSGDRYHASNEGNHSLTIAAARTTTVLNCNPSQVVANQNVLCDILVQNNPSTVDISSTGMVEVTSNFASASCTLVVGECSTTLTPASSNAIGDQVIRAS